MEQELKQKQIEEMAKIMCDGCIENELMTCSFTHEKIPCDFARNFAEALLNAGYGNLRAFAEALKEKLQERRKICFEKWGQAENRDETEMSNYWNGKMNENDVAKSDIDETLNEFLGGEK